MNTNIFIENTLNTAPNRIVLSADDTNITYAQLYEQVNRLTDSLRKLGIGKGDRVGFLDRNGSETIVTYFSVSRLCAVFVPLNYDASTDELYEMIGMVHLDAIFLGDEHLSIISVLKKKFSNIRHIIPIKRKIYGLLEYHQLLKDGRNEYFIVPTKGDEVNTILFTSGVAGKPKAVALGHDNFVDLVLSHCSSDGTSGNETFLLNVPLYHINGLSSIMPHFYHGNRLILMKYFFADDWVILVNEEKVNSTFLPPSFLAEILDSSLLPKADLSSLHTITYGGDSVYTDIITSAVSKFPPHVQLTGSYGLTETTKAIALLAPEEHRPGEETQHIHFGTIGKVIPDVTIIVADTNGNRLQNNEIGELLVHMCHPMKGYIDSDSHQVIPFNDYWIHTEDLGYINDEGYIFLKGKKLESSIKVNDKQSNMSDCSVSVYPAKYAEQNVSTDFQETKILEDSSIHILELYRIMKFMQKCHESLNVNDIINNYMCGIPEILGNSAYGIHLVPQNDLDSMSYEYGNCIHKWKRPRFDALPVTSVISSNIEEKTRETDKYYSFIESISLQEFAKRTQPGQWIRTPMFTPSHDLIGVLSFVRTDKNDYFTSHEQCLIRLISSHMCDVFVTSIRYFALEKQHRINEHIIKTFGCPIIVSKDNGKPLYMNEYMPELLEAKPDLVSEMSYNVQELIHSNLSTITKLIQVSTGGKLNWLKMKTVCVPQANDNETRLFVTAIFADSDTLDFEYFSDTLNQREIDVLTLVSQGLHNSEISQELNISVDTVKFYLKILFQKFNVSTRTELIIYIYNLYGSKYPFFCFLL